MLVDCLVFRSPEPDEEGFVPPAELLRRVADRFPYSTIDRDRGDQWIQAAADEMVTLGLPPTDTLVVNHRALVGQVAHVTVREKVGGPQFGFFVLPQPTVIDIEYDQPEHRELCRPLLEELCATLAEYDLQTDDLLG